jgi:hypothetical protein
MRTPMKQVSIGASRSDRESPTLGIRWGLTRAFPWVGRCKSISSPPLASVMARPISQHSYSGHGACKSLPANETGRWTSGFGATGRVLQSVYPRTFFTWEVP